MSFSRLAGVVMNRRLGILAAAILLSIGAAGSGLGQDAAGTPPLSREAIEAIVREYILRHPEIILESVQSLQARQQAEARARTSARLRELQPELTADTASPVGGNPKGDITVVEFFDYRCRYCKSVAPTVKQLMRDDRSVRLVYKEFPILGPDSLYAARAALAAERQGKYEPFHEALMAATSDLTAGQVDRIAATVKLDMKRLAADMRTAEIQSVLDRNMELARELGITGTPAFVVGDELLRGAVDLAALKEVVARARRR
jgi:protein-disulfide isomerase